MARFTEIVPINSGSYFTGESASAFTCLPQRRPCPSLPVPWIYPGDEWDCQACGDEPKFAAPWVRGDVIPLLLTLPDNYNALASEPDAGWSDADGEGYIDVTIKGVDDVELFTGAHHISEKYFVSWCASSGLSMQYIELDTSLLPVDTTCFKVCVITRDAQGNESDPITTNLFMRADGICNTEDTVLIEGTNVGTGCGGECYGEPRFVYNVWPRGAWCAPVRRVRVRGVFKLEAIPSPQFEITDLGFPISTKTSKAYSLRTGYLPPWAACWLSSVLESNETITIDRQTFDSGTVSVQTSNQNNRMLAFDVGVFTECTVSNDTCT